jgi:prepilin-type N-terminal cleavage/methylation domain
MLILAIGCNSNTSKGFTLIEILVVLLILAISLTLIILNFSSLNSIEKQVKSFEYTFDVLSQESILTGNIVAWYYDSEGEYAAYLFKNTKVKL